MTTPTSSWHPIAASDDLPTGHVYQTRLLRQELAVWRDDEGFVNVWENRCRHRGVRLSIGINTGRELVCQYHGWRYASRTARCTLIPAHPEHTPANSMTARAICGEERHGLVWACLDAGARMPEEVDLPGPKARVLRAIPMKVDAHTALQMLQGYRFQPDGLLAGQNAAVVANSIDEWTVRLVASEDGFASTIVFFLQPVDDDRCIVRGLLTGEGAADDTLAILRHHNERLSRMRDRAENRSVRSGAGPAVASCS